MTIIQDSDVAILLQLVTDWGGRVDNGLLGYNHRPKFERLRDAGLVTMTESTGVMSCNYGSMTFSTHYVTVTVMGLDVAESAMEMAREKLLWLQRGKEIDDLEQAVRALGQ